MSRWRRRLFLGMLLGAVCSLSLALGPTLAAGPGWPQWGQNPQHTGQVNVAGQSLDRALADVVYDPFVPAEQKASGGDLLAHYQAPLIDNRGDVFMAFKAGQYTGASTWNTQVWTEQRLRWQDGQLVEQWTFASDWKPEPNAPSVGSSPIERWGLSGWEPVFHAVLANDAVYVPGAGGTIFKVNKSDGTAVARLNPFGGALDPNTFVAGPLSADSAGNIYYNVLKLDPTDPYGAGGADIPGAWLVRVGGDGSTSMVPYTALVADAPTTCSTTFSLSQLPWPPSPDATPPQGPCGAQRPGINVAPAIAPDGTIYTVSRAHLRTRYSYVVAVNPDLSPKWHTSLRSFLNDGCNVLLPPNGTPGGCTAGATTGVDPATNERPAGRVIDQSSSSPTVAPDGGVLYGSYSRYNYARGHLWKLSAAGQIQATYDFGWDQTPAIYSHDGAYSIAIKDNHYDAGSYCNDNKLCPVAPPGPFYITQLSGATLQPEWQFRSTNTLSCSYGPNGMLKCKNDHPGGFEWCINAPAIDRNGVVYANSEDGNLYAINQGGTLKQNLFLNLALGAAYTPLAIGPDGLLYTENDGHLFVVGQ
jgi:hypothetical protein